MILLKYYTLLLHLNKVVVHLVWFENRYSGHTSFFEHAVLHSSQASVSVVMASVERLAGIVRRTSGVIPESSAEVYFILHTLNSIEYSNLIYLH